VADEFLQEQQAAAFGDADAGPAAASAGPRGALRTLLVSRRPRLPAWARVVGGWPLAAEGPAPALA
jgi:hypothetical protein